jgi:hypothetical protein
MAYMLEQHVLEKTYYSSDNVDLLEEAPFQQDGVRPQIIYTILDDLSCEF